MERHPGFVDFSIQYNISMDRNSKELSYYRLSLQRYLQEQGDVSLCNDDFLDARSGAAEEEYENARRDGLTVDQAQERAMSVLFDGLS